MKIFPSIKFYAMNPEFNQSLLNGFNAEVWPIIEDINNSKSENMFFENKKIYGFFFTYFHTIYLYFLPNEKITCFNTIQIIREKSDYLININLKNTPNKQYIGKSENHKINFKETEFSNKLYDFEKNNIINKILKYLKKFFKYYSFLEINALLLKNTPKIKINYFIIQKKNKIEKQYSFFQVISIKNNFTIFNYSQTQKDQFPKRKNLFKPYDINYNFLIPIEKLKIQDSQNMQENKDIKDQNGQYISEKINKKIIINPEINDDFKNLQKNIDIKGQNGQYISEKIYNTIINRNSPIENPYTKDEKTKIILNIEKKISAIMPLFSISDNEKVIIFSYNDSFNKLLESINNIFPHVFSLDLAITIYLELFHSYSNNLTNFYVNYIKKLNKNSNHYSRNILCNFQKFFEKIKSETIDYIIFEKGIQKERFLLEIMNKINQAYPQKYEICKYTLLQNIHYYLMLNNQKAQKKIMDNIFLIINKKKCSFCSKGSKEIKSEIIKLKLDKYKMILKKIEKMIDEKRISPLTLIDNDNNQLKLKIPKNFEAINIMNDEFIKNFSDIINFIITQYNFANKDNLNLLLYLKENLTNFSDNIIQDLTIENQSEFIENRNIKKNLPNLTREDRNFWSHNKLEQQNINKNYKIFPNCKCEILKINLLKYINDEKFYKIPYNEQLFFAKNIIQYIKKLYINSKNNCKVCEYLSINLINYINSIEKKNKIPIDFLMIILKYITANIKFTKKDKILEEVFRTINFENTLIVHNSVIFNSTQVNIEKNPILKEISIKYLPQFLQNLPDHLNQKFETANSLYDYANFIIYPDRAEDLFSQYNKKKPNDHEKKYNLEQLYLEYCGNQTIKKTYPIFLCQNQIKEIFTKIINDNLNLLPINFIGIEIKKTLEIKIPDIIKKHAFILLTNPKNIEWDTETFFLKLINQPESTIQEYEEKLLPSIEIIENQIKLLQNKIDDIFYLSYLYFFLKFYLNKYIFKKNIEIENTIQDLIFILNKYCLSCKINQTRLLEQTKEQTINFLEKYNVNPIQEIVPLSNISYFNYDILFLLNIPKNPTLVQEASSFFCKQKIQYLSKNFINFTLFYLLKSAILHKNQDLLKYLLLKLYNISFKEPTFQYIIFKINFKFLKKEFKALLKKEEKIPKNNQLDDSKIQLFIQIENQNYQIKKKLLAYKKLANILLSIENSILNDENIEDYYNLILMENINKIKNYIITKIFIVSNNKIDQQNFSLELSDNKNLSSNFYYALKNIDNEYFPQNCYFLKVLDYQTEKQNNFKNFLLTVKELFRNYNNFMICYPFYKKNIFKNLNFNIKILILYFDNLFNQIDCFKKKLKNFK